MENLEQFGGEVVNRIADRVAQPRGCGQVLERGAVCQEQRVSEGRAHHPVGVRGLTLVVPAHGRIPAGRGAVNSGSPFESGWVHGQAKPSWWAGALPRYRTGQPCRAMARRAKGQVRSDLRHRLSRADQNLRHGQPVRRAQPANHASRYGGAIRDATSQATGGSRLGPRRLRRSPSPRPPSTRMTRLGTRPLGICAAHIAAPLTSFVWRTFLFRCLN
jgi:hypothetical protein